MYPSLTKGVGRPFEQELGNTMTRTYEYPRIEDLGTLADITRGNPIVSTGGIAVSLEGAEIHGPGPIDISTGGISVHHDGISVYGP